MEGELKVFLSNEELHVLDGGGVYGEIVNAFVEQCLAMRGACASARTDLHAEYIHLHAE